MDKSELVIVFIENPGILGYVTRGYRNNVIDARYYLDGIAYKVTLTEDEYRIFNREGE